MLCPFFSICFLFSSKSSGNPSQIIQKVSGGVGGLICIPYMNLDNFTYFLLSILLLFFTLLHSLIFVLKSVQNHLEDWKPIADHGVVRGLICTIYYFYFFFHFFFFFFFLLFCVFFLSIFVFKSLQNHLGTHRRSYRRCQGVNIPCIFFFSFYVFFFSLSFSCFSPFFFKFVF